MIAAILGGLGAAAAWTASTVCSSRSSRLLDPGSVLGWVMLFGLIVAAPPALAMGVPAALHRAPGAWLLLSGAGNVGGLLLAYGALRVGQVALVAPVLSTEGAMAAMIAIAAGESLSPAVAATLGLIVCGITLASIPARSDEHRRPGDHGRSVVLAVSAAVAFGVSLYATGRAGSGLPAAWVGAAARIIGVPVITIPLALSGRLRLTRRAAPLVAISGLCEVLGFYAYTLGARHGIAVAAVLSSQFGSFSAVVGYLFLRDRLSRVQLGGVIAAAAGVAVLSALQA